MSLDQIKSCTGTLHVHDAYIVLIYTRIYILYVFIRVCVCVDIYIYIYQQYNIAIYRWVSRIFPTISLLHGFLRHIPPFSRVHAFEQRLFILFHTRVYDALQYVFLSEKTYFSSSPLSNALYKRYRIHVTKHISLKFNPLVIIKTAIISFRRCHVFFDEANFCGRDILTNILQR